MNLEVTLYVDKQFDVKSKELKNTVKKLIEDIVDLGLQEKKLFNFYKTKADLGWTIFLESSDRFNQARVIADVN